MVVRSIVGGNYSGLHRSMKKNPGEIVSHNGQLGNGSFDQLPHSHLKQIR